jgi:exopolyphosphatase/guanosine-5'-triphosphate,3'-diphosphate pyrophosphatase
MICAAIDFGSNAIRIFIADVTVSKQYEIFVKYRYPVKIGSEVFKNQKVSDNTIDEIVEVFRKFKSHFKAYKVETYIAVATSALRDAHNKD